MVGGTYAGIQPGNPGGRRRAIDGAGCRRNAGTSRTGSETGLQNASGLSDETRETGTGRWTMAVGPSPWNQADWIRIGSMIEGTEPGPTVNEVGERKLLGMERCAATGCSTPELHASGCNGEAGVCRGLLGPSGHELRIPERIGTRLNGATPEAFRNGVSRKPARKLPGSAKMIVGSDRLGTQ